MTMDYRYLAFPKVYESSQEMNHHDLLIWWHDILNTYGSLNLTKSSDKLPALAGIARRYNEKIRDRYLAGLWRRSLIKDLYWRVNRASRLSYYRAPSWSWASIDGTPDVGILTRSSKKIEVLAELVDSFIELKGSNPYGEVKTGWVKLQAPLQRLTLTGRVSRPYYPKYGNKYLVVRTDKGDPIGCDAEFDFDFGVETLQEDDSTLTVNSPEGVEVFAVVLTRQFSPHSKETEKDRKLGYCCLIVCPIEVGSQSMRRLGHFWMDISTMGECKYLKPSVEWPVITLV
jgi:hypothetical protein